MSSGATAENAGSTRPADIKAVPVRHPGRWVAMVVIGVLVAMFVHGAFFVHVHRGTLRQNRIPWDIVRKYLFSSNLLHGAVLTIELTAIAMAIGIAGGVLLAVMRMSVNPVVSGVAWVYVWFFRGTPVLVQLLFWYNISYLIPTPEKLTLGVPFGPAFVHFNPNTLITAFVAVSVGLGLNEAAYMSEIVRAGILSVDEGQTEAASSLGMTRGMTLRRIILPQAMRVIIPPTGNETISMLKTTSLAYVASVPELTTAASRIYATNYQTIPLLTVASLWYLFITSILTVIQYYVERYYARGSVRQLPPTPWQRFRTMLTTFHAPPPATVALTGRVGGAP